MKITGFVLILIGLALTIYTSVNVFTKEKVVDLGKLQITHEQPHYYSWSPLLGFAVILIGVLVVWQASRK
jgi:hypothetical protein